jgi:hypothetical protein
MNSFSNHLNGKTRSKKIGLGVVFIEVNDSVVIAWTLAMQECGLPISLQQLKMKVANDALLSSLLNPLEGPSVLSCGNMELGGAPDFQH